MAFTPPGSTSTLPKVATAPVDGRAAGGEDASAAYGPSGRAGPPGGSCRRGWPAPAKSNRQRPCGQMALAEADRASPSVEVEAAALLDVQLDEGADRGRAARGRGRGVGVVPGGRIASARRDAVARR